MSRDISITITFKRGTLSTYTDEHLAHLFHVTQANPAEITDVDAIDAADEVNAEIVRRWLRDAPLDQFSHQGRHMRAVVAETEDRCG